MDVLRDNIMDNCKKLLENIPNRDSAIKQIDQYLMSLYMDRDINGFSKLSFTKRNKVEGLYFGIQLPGYHGMNGWIDIFIPISSQPRAFADFDRSMKGL